MTSRLHTTKGFLGCGNHPYGRCFFDEADDFFSPSTTKSVRRGTDQRAERRLGQIRPRTLYFCL